ncbi:HTH domain-containing protein [Candidatus Woesearchaeota archaeon]|nr:HTH domain-containing protein [Candidatus Woesearchaeota archaeon]
MTRRQQIIQILRQTPQTVKQLADYFEVTRGEIETDLVHIEKSVRAENQKLVIQPASCRECSFVFRERSRLRKPSKCPRCKSEAITEPVFSISSQNPQQGNSQR